MRLAYMQKIFHVSADKDREKLCFVELIISPVADLIFNLCVLIGLVALYFASCYFSIALRHIIL